MSTTRSKFLRLRALWKRRLSEFQVVQASDGLEYVVPVPSRGPARVPYSKLERRVDNARVVDLKGSTLDRSCVPSLPCDDWTMGFRGEYVRPGD